jgi:hypothetical protein
VPQPEAKAKPQPEAKAEPQPEANAEAKPEAVPQSEAKAGPQPQPEAKPEVKAGVATLLNTSLGELLLAGLVKDPEDAGRIIAAAITQAEAPIAAAKAPETKADLKPETEAEPKPGAEAKTPSDSTPWTAK